MKPEQLDLFQVPAGRPEPPDQAARDIVAHALDTTLFVEAGAGSGKTTSLVARVVNLVCSGIPITSIAAITFTEKAAAELRHRVRQSLEEVLRNPTTSLAPQAVELVTAAVADVDHAPIGTLHAFARRLLSEFPVESRLPPRFDVLDEVQSATAFDERFTDFLEALLDQPETTRLVELCAYDNFRIDVGVRRMADDFQSNWDLVEERVSPSVPPQASADIDALVGMCDALLGFDVPPADRHHATLADLRSSRRLLLSRPTLGELLGELDSLTKLKAAGGDKAKWKKHGAPAGSLEEFRALLGGLGVAAARQLAAFNEERRLTLGALLREFTLASVAERQARGTLEFHDLLVFARRLVIEHAGARAQLHHRYTRLLLDEFQDTDPIQLELAVRIAAAPDDHVDDWTKLRPLPGRLCVVGDPKQSIYRFRRADIAQFLRARDQIGATTATLSANFRSSPAVIEWVNHTMGTLIQAEPDVQPHYEALANCRDAPGQRGSVTVLGESPHEDLGRAYADLLRSREADDVADVIVQALSQGWPVLDEAGAAAASAAGSGDAPVRPCRPGDIAILLPARTSLPVLQAALAARGLAYRAENSSLVYAATEIRSLMLALRAIDDPTDELAIVSALRTSLYGCSDRDLYEWKVEHALRWNWRQEVPEHLRSSPVAVGLASLGALAEALPWSTPSQLLTSLVEQRGVLELALASPQHSRDVWRRVRFVIDQARAWSEAGGHGVRSYLTWTRLQGDDGRFVAETVLPETDHDAVRIMTIHAAKGLEFPIAIVSGLTARPSTSRGRRVVWPPGTWTLSDPTDGVYQQFAPVDEQMSAAERRRLLYVATTRAQDHLVVSLHRAAKPDSTSAWWLADAAAGADQQAFIPHELQLAITPPSTTELPWADEVQWAQARDAHLARASTTTVLSATALAAQFATDPAMQKDAVDLDLPPWQRGRYGTAVGRAVHGVLQYADLDRGRDVARLSVAQAAAEGVLGHERTIEQLARSAIASDVVRGGVAGEHWRELFVATALGERVIEGYIDLLVRDPQRGLVVVDYKTDQLGASADRVARVQRYGIQLAAYGVALEELLHEPVAAGVLVLCRTSGSAESVEIEHWEQLKAALRQRLLAAS